MKTTYSIFASGIASIMAYLLNLQILIFFLVIMVSYFTAKLPDINIKFSVKKNSQFRTHGLFFFIFISIIGSLIIIIIAKFLSLFYLCNPLTKYEIAKIFMIIFIATYSHFILDLIMYGNFNNDPISSQNKNRQIFYKFIFSLVGIMLLISGIFGNFSIQTQIINNLILKIIFLVIFIIVFLSFIIFSIKKHRSKISPLNCFKINESRDVCILGNKDCETLMGYRNGKKVKKQICKKNDF